MTDAPPDDAPQIEDGYMPVANTLLPGLMLAPVYHESKLILCEVVMRWIGRAKATTFRIDVPKIAERWGVKRTNVWRGFRQLKDRGVLVEHNGDELTVKIDKRALMKLLPENVRNGLKSFGEDAADGTWFGVKITPAKSVSSVIQERIKSDTLALEDRITGDTHTVSSVIQNRITGDTLSASPLDPPIRKRIEEVKKQQPAPENQSPAPQGQRDGLPGNETPDDSVLTAIRTLINSRIEPSQNNRQLWDNIHANRRVFPTWWIMKALKRSIIRQPGRVPKWGYLLPILQDWATSASRQPDGGPEDGYTDTLELVQYTGTVQSIPMPTLAMSPANQRRAEMKRQCMIMHERAQEEMRRNAGA